MQRIAGFVHPHDVGTEIVIDTDRQGHPLTLGRITAVATAQDFLDVHPKFNDVRPCPYPHYYWYTVYDQDPGVLAFLAECDRQAVPLHSYRV